MKKAINIMVKVLKIVRIVELALLVIGIGVFIALSGLLYRTMEEQGAEQAVIIITIVYSAVALLTFLVKFILDLVFAAGAKKVANAEEFSRSKHIVWGVLNIVFGFSPLGVLLILKSIFRY